MEAGKHRIRPWIRWTAAFLALVFIFVLGAQNWITVKIAVEEENAAKTYLAEQTAYANASSLERLAARMRALTQPESLDDYYLLAQINIATEEYEKALTYIEQCLALYLPEYGTDLEAELLLKKGCLLTILGRSIEAETIMKQVLTLAPNVAEIYLVLAQIHAESGTAREVCEDLESYLDLQPDADDMRLLLAQLYLSMEETEAALEQVEYLKNNGSEEKTALAELYTGIGLSKMQTEDYTEAISLFETAIPLDDTVESLCYYAGLCSLLLEEYDSAVEYYSRSIEQEDSLQMSYYGRGMAELMRSTPDLEQAKEDLVFAVEYTGEDADPVICQQAEELLDTIEEEKE